MRDHPSSRKQSRRSSTEIPGGDGYGSRSAAQAPAQARRRPGPGSNRGRVDRKALQLCHQISRTLDEVFAESSDDVIRNLHVLSVLPAPDVSRLLVTVAPDGGYTSDGPDPAVIVGRLSRAAAHLREEVAGAITRKRTPVLLYQLAAPGTENS